MHLTLYTFRINHKQLFMHESLFSENTVLHVNSANLLTTVLIFAYIYATTVLTLVPRMTNI